MNTVYKLFNWYFNKNALPFWFIFIFDCLVVLASGVLSYAVDHGPHSTMKVIVPLLGTMSFYLLFFILGFKLTHSYAGVLRYASFSDLYRVGFANLMGVCCVAMKNISVSSLKRMGMKMWSACMKKRNEATQQTPETPCLNRVLQEVCRDSWHC